MKPLRSALGALIGASVGANLLLLILWMTSSRLYGRLVLEMLFIHISLTTLGIVLPGVCFWLVGSRRVRNLTSDHDVPAEEGVFRPHFLGPLCALGCLGIACWYVLIAILGQTLNFSRLKDWQVGAVAFYIALLLLSLLIAGPQVGVTIFAGGARTRWLRKLLGVLWSVSLAILMTLALTMSAEATGMKFDRWTSHAVALFWILLLAEAMFVAWGVSARSHQDSPNQAAFIGNVCVGGAVVGALLHFFLSWWPEYQHHNMHLERLWSFFRFESWTMLTMLLRGPLLLGAACLGWFLGAGLAARKNFSRIVAGRCGVIIGFGFGMLCWGIMSASTQFNYSVFRKLPLVWYVGLALSVLVPAIIGLCIGLVAQPGESRLPGSSKGRTLAARMTVASCGALMGIIFLMVVLASLKPEFITYSVAALAVILSVIVLFLFVMARVGWFLGGLLGKGLDQWASQHGEVIEAESVPPVAVSPQPWRSVWGKE